MTKEKRPAKLRPGEAQEKDRPTKLALADLESVDAICELVELAHYSGTP